MISIIDSVSPNVINANNATNPGVRTKRGNALLNSNFLIASITQRNAIAPRIDLIKRTNKLVFETAEKFIKKKKGIAIIKLKIARVVENASAFSLNKIFFSISADVAEKNAEVRANKYHTIRFRNFLDI